MTISLTNRVLASVVLMGAMATANAADTLHNTTWQTIDDETGKPKAVVRITEKGGKLEGKIEKLYNYKPKQVCTKCKGKYKDKSLVGAKIFWGLKADGKNEYTAGKIFDPKKGKSYKLNSKIVNGGKALEMRGYIGFSFAGRTQTWKRLK